MTVQSPVSKVTLLGNGSAKVWPFAFRVVDDSHLEITVTDAAGVETRVTSGYSVVLTASGGTVTYPQVGPPLASGTRITLRRVVPLTQETAFANQGGFYADAHEERFDLAVMADQQLQEQLNRAVLAPVGDAAPITLPSAAARAGKAMAFSADGQATTSSMTLAQIEAGATAGIASGRVTIPVPVPVVMADGVKRRFDTGLPLLSPQQVISVIGGTYQLPEAYTVDGTAVVYHEPPPAGLTVDHRVIAALSEFTTGFSTASPQALGVASPGGTGLMADAGHVHPLPTLAALGAATAAQGGKADSAVQPAALTVALSGKSDMGHGHAQADITGLGAALALLAPLMSPAFSGEPSAPTPPPNTNTSRLATCAWVMGQIAGLVNSSPAALDTLNELASALGNDPNFAATVATALGLKAPLASPALTGTPTAPTAAPGVSTTQIATTAFVQAAAALLAPLSGATFTGPARSKVSPVAYASTVTLDLSTGNDFIVTLGGALTLANPVNQAGGHGGIIQITQGASGGVTPTFGSNWKLLNTATWNTAANGVSLVSYYIVTPGVVGYSVLSRAA